MNEKIFIGDLNKGDVLAALYNASKPQGMGFMQYNPTPMERKEAEELLKRGKYFDYIRGRVMKVNLDGEEFDAGNYDCDNGPGAAKAVIDELRKLKDANTSRIQKMHKESTFESAIEANKVLTEETSIKKGDNDNLVISLGLGEFVDVLGPKIDNAIKLHKEKK